MLSYHTRPAQILQNSTRQQVVLFQCEVPMLSTKADPQGSAAGADLIFCSGQLFFKPKQHHRTQCVFNQWLWIYVVSASSCQHQSTNSELFKSAM